MISQFIEILTSMNHNLESFQMVNLSSSMGSLQKASLSSNSFFFAEVVETSIGAEGFIIEQPVCIYSGKDA